MASTEYETLRRDVNAQPEWKAIALCAACAEKMGTIVLMLGLPSTCELAKTSLDYFWSSVLNARDVDRAVELEKALATSPEWQVNGDNAYFAWIVASALDYFKFALDAIAGKSPREQAVNAMATLSDVAQWYDIASAGFPAPNEIRLRGAKLEQEEIASQSRIMALLKNADSPSDWLVKQLRQECQSISLTFSELLPIYVFNFVQARIKLPYWPTGDARE